MVARILACFLIGTGWIIAAEKPMTGVQRSDFGQTADGQAVDLFTLTNANGLKAQITSYGATWTTMTVPDRQGRFADILLGYDDLKGFQSKGNPYFGCIVGRVANRVGNARLTIDGKEHRLAANNGKHSLHGGAVGFDKKVWKAEVLSSASGPAMRFRLTSPDGDEGYPGTLQVQVVYTLTDKNELRIDYEAVTDRLTPVNLTNHAYFNLTGDPSQSVLGHRLRIVADRYTPSDETLLPTGQIVPVKGTPLDFTTLTPIGQRIGEVKGDPSGYDHNFVLNSGGKELALAARVEEPKSGRVMEVLTTEPGLQFYTGNYLDGSITGKKGVVYKKHAGFCLEAQHFPDSPNKPEFPSILLKPGQTYRQTTVHRFVVDKAPSAQ